MTSEEITSLQKHVDERLDAIEKLINLSLIMNQMDEVMNRCDEVCQSGKEDEQREQQLKDILHEYYFEVYKEERHGNKTLLYLKSLRQIKLPTVRRISVLIRNIGRNLLPVFLFEKINITR